MSNTPISMRKHVAIFGDTNVGKSTLFNSLLGQDVAIVSNISGTTTDPVIKMMELIPYGPIALIDTAGLDDITELGNLRTKRTHEMLRRTDLILYVVDAVRGCKHKKINEIPVINIFTKCDLISPSELKILEEKNPSSIFLSGTNDKEGLNSLKDKIIKELEKQNRDDETLLGDLLPPHSSVVLVIPIDSAAPKGRIILPQVQVIRDCLDHDIKAYVTKETTLCEALDDLKCVDLVVTDSQVFSQVDEIIPKNIPLTSFSMLLARQKGNFSQLINGAKSIDTLENGDKVLILEGCTHSTTHEDIGKVKIPALINKRTGSDVTYCYASGYDFPDDISEYKMVIQCGMCMINKREIQSRLDKLAAKGLPVTNYGVVLAYLTGILDRAKEIYERA